MKISTAMSVSLTVLIGAAGSACAQTNNCAALPASSDFSVETLATAAGWPYDIQVDAAGKVYWIERLGAFKVLDQATKQVTIIKQFNVFATRTANYYGDVEHGLEGMALDLNFATNGWVYIWRTLPGGATSQHNLGPTQRLARFTLKNNGTQLDEASEKPLFEHKIYAQCCHFGGSLRMSADGILYLATGDNIHFTYTGTGAVRAFDESNAWSDPRTTSSNTDDTRGKILRFKPLPFPDSQTPAMGVGTTYTIPAGNLKEVWPSTESDKVRPEIWSMGHRNPFSLTVHPDKPWAGIGEANGDNPEQGDDEINIVTKAGYFGWPLLIGANQNYLPGFWSARGYDPSAFASTGVINDSKFNTGAKTLPPATGAAITVRHGGMTMPINCHGVVWGWVDHDEQNPNRGKFPPYLKGKLLVSGYGRSDVRAATVDETGKVTRLEILFPGAFGDANGNFTTDVLRGVQGPDGAFYVGKGNGFGYSTDNFCKLFKISYKGACSVVSTRPSSGKLKALLARRRSITHLGATEVRIPAGIRRARAYDMAGKQVWESVRASDEVAATAVIPASVPAGALRLRWFAE